jgi:hypothetical protein
MSNRKTTEERLDDYDISEPNSGRTIWLGPISAATICTQRKMADDDVACVTLIANAVSARARQRLLPLNARASNDHNEMKNRSSKPSHDILTISSGNARGLHNLVRQLHETSPWHPLL